MTQLEYRIGCSGFYNRHWRGLFYPIKHPQRKWFEYYSEQLNSLEINSTFYRFPKVERLKSWYDRSPAHFVFSVKAPQLITHFKSFNDCSLLLDDFYLACEQGLLEKLGCVLFQLPARIEFSDAKLEKIISCMRPGFNNVIEFRHVSWWNETVYAALKEHHIIFCNVSHHDLPGDVIATSPVLYIRLHGHKKMFYSNYEQEELEALQNQIIAQPGLRQVFVYFNNTAGDHGILNALAFQEMARDQSLEGRGNP